MSRLARGDDSLTVLEKTYAIAKLIEDSRFWQVSGDIRGGGKKMVLPPVLTRIAKAGP